MKKLNLKNAVKFALGKEETHAVQGGIGHRKIKMSQVVYRNIPAPPAQTSTNPRRSGAVVGVDDQN
ncbi:MAG TPA: hypothetical protein PLL64_14470 [Rhodothermales bacterium]|nr:hypothetical protein [Rhodothermales bacterium]HRR07831.1 hypothetical protein [Rhodothermales bacterium]